MKPAGSGEQTRTSNLLVLANKLEQELGPRGLPSVVMGKLLLEGAFIKLLSLLCHFVPLSACSLR